MIPQEFHRRTFRDHFHIEGPTKVGVLSDIHFPFHASREIAVALKECKRRGVNAILINGDMMECEGVSSWDKAPDGPTLADEIKCTQQFLDHIKSKFPKARVIFKHGNHEEWVERYIWKNAPRLFGALTMTLDQAIGRPVEVVKDKRVIMLGKLAVIHGHEYRFAISNPVNPARGFFLRCKESVIGGHFHQFSSHSERTVTGRVITTWSTGCLRWLDPDFMPMNNHVHGAAIIEVDGKGHYQVDNFRILDGEIRR